MTFDMFEILDLHLRGFVRIKAILGNPVIVEGQRRSTNFTIDPDTTNYTKLRNRFARIFNLDGEFTISFRKDKTLIPLTSDWDLDGAISEASKPQLTLVIKSDPVDKTLEEWDIICPADIALMEQGAGRRFSQRSKSFAGSIISQVETAMQKVQRALSFDFNNNVRDCHRPVDEDEYNSLLDSKGRLLNVAELFRRSFRGGVEPSMRPVIWKHLLNVFPRDMTLDERKRYSSSKYEEYYQLRYRWQHLMRAGTVPDVLQDITNMVKKDVRRTDRTEKFYSGADDSENVRALFNILTTFAVNHPNIAYCQGMSDLLSPILYVMKNESHAYVCFCGLMKRVRNNFTSHGRSMKLKFRHLQKMLRFYDEELYLYLKDQEALDLLFCYRWLLLELKREFPYHEMLHLMEIIWASLPPKPPQKELELYGVKFPTTAICNSLKDRTTLKDYLKLNEDHFGKSHHDYENCFFYSLSSSQMTAKIKKWARRVRRESIARNIENGDSSSEEEIRLPVHYRKRKYRDYIEGKLLRMNKNNPTSNLKTRSCKIPDKKNYILKEICRSWSCGEVYEEKRRNIDALYDAREFLRNQWCYSNTVNEIQLNNWLNRKRLEMKKSELNTKDNDLVVEEENNRQRHGSSDSNYGTISETLSEVEEEEPSEDNPPQTARRSQSEGYLSDTDSKEASTPQDYDDDDDYDSETEAYDDYTFEEDDYIDSMAGRQYEKVPNPTYFDKKKEMLPQPSVLGDGNPFLLFVCIAMIQSHRDEIMRRQFDFNELGIHFDKFVRKHKLYTVLYSAQDMFIEYLNMGWDVEDTGISSDEQES